MLNSEEHGKDFPCTNQHFKRTAFECFKAQTEQAGMALLKFFSAVFTTESMQF